VRQDGTLVRLGLQPCDVIDYDNVYNYSVLIIITIITRKYEKPYSGLEVIGTENVINWAKQLKA
jgi:hypothetical protein